MSTHTPGPWVVECDKFIATPDAIVIAELNDGLRGEYPKSGHFNANAQLIAAAPAMYEALRALVDVFPSVVRTTPYGVSMDISKLHDKAKAALAQAEGR